MRLGEPRAGDDAAVTALGFSPLGNLVGVGHANGDVAFWELKRSGWELAKTVKGALAGASPARSLSSQTPLFCSSMVLPAYLLPIAGLPFQPRKGCRTGTGAACVPRGLYAGLCMWHPREPWLLDARAAVRNLCQTGT